MCAAASTFAAGCDDDGQRDVAQMLSQMRSEYLRQDYRAACARLTQRAQRELGLIGHAPPSGCEKDMARRMSSKVLSKRDLSVPRLSDLRLDGDRATGRLSIASEEPLSVRFAREGGAWKLDTLFSGVRRRQRLSRTVSGSTSSSPTVSRVFADRRTAPCPRLEVRGLAVEGGCVSYAVGLATMTTLNVFGDRRYGRCPISFTLRVGPDGAVAVGDVLAQLSPDPFDMCGDVRPCHTPLGREVRWTGRFEVHRSGRTGLALSDMCMDTCLGRFVGRFRFDLTEAPRGRTVLSARRVNIGNSGLFVSGDWKLQPPAPGERLAIGTS
jgi:hypothetical protein